MPRIQICHDLLQKNVEVTDGCRLDIIQHEVQKRMVTVTGISKLKCEAYESCQCAGYMLYCVEVKAPTDVVMFHIWVRWYEDGKGHA